MKILVLLGSRNSKGQTAKAVQSLLEGVKNEKTQIEEVFLPLQNIERCRQCNENGWGICRSQGRCIIEDDLSSLIDKIKKSDIIVFATPVYFSDLSESLKSFLDRLRRTTMHDKGKEGITNKPSLGICVAGGGGGGATSCTFTLEKTLYLCGFDVLDMVAVRRQNLNMKLEVLKITGKWLGNLEGK